MYVKTGLITRLHTYYVYAWNIDREITVNGYLLELITSSAANVYGTFADGNMLTKLLEQRIHKYTRYLPSY